MAVSHGVTRVSKRIGDTDPGCREVQSSVELDIEVQCHTPGVFHYYSVSLFYSVYQNTGMYALH